MNELTHDAQREILRSQRSAAGTTNTSLTSIIKHIRFVVLLLAVALTILATWFVTAEHGWWYGSYLHGSKSGAQMESDLQAANLRVGVLESQTEWLWLSHSMTKSLLLDDPKYIKRDKAKAWKWHLKSSSTSELLMYENIIRGNNNPNMLHWLNGRAKSFSKEPQPQARHTVNKTAL